MLSISSPLQIHHSIQPQNNRHPFLPLNTLQTSSLYLLPSFPGTSLPWVSLQWSLFNWWLFRARTLTGAHYPVGLLSRGVSCRQCFFSNTSTARGNYTLEKLENFFYLPYHLQLQSQWVCSKRTNTEDEIQHCNLRVHSIPVLFSPAQNVHFCRIYELKTPWKIWFMMKIKVPSKDIPLKSKQQDLRSPFSQLVLTIS